MAVRTAFRELTVREGVKSAAGSQVDAHVELALISEAGRPWIICAVCGSRWSVVLSQTDGGDGYCVEGATNYYGSDGKVIKRL